MQIRKLTVQGFRGIGFLEWTPQSAVVCLLGPGDSTKTTILDALELALGARWAIPVSDSDFHGGKPDQPIVITVTVGRLHSSLTKEEKYGLDLRGWSANAELHDEPMPGDEPVLTIRFQIDDSLEPSWTVIHDRRPEGKHMPARDREFLGVVRLGADADRHLAWGRGSALTRSTDDLAEVNRVVAGAQREAREAVAAASLTKLKEAASNAEAAAVRLGVRVNAGYRPGLESTSISFGASQLSLHDGEIPVRAAGLGSRRLSALALQRAAVRDGALLLVDEVEHGLEPHRLRHLLSELGGSAGESGQVLLTTHSRVPLEELRSEQLYVVRCVEGVTTVNYVGTELQDVARGNAEALLGRRVLVCEGATEVGLCRGLQTYWARRFDDVPFAHTGTALAKGGGSTAPQIAMKLAGLGFQTALLRDSDVQLDPEVSTELARCHVEVLAWEGSVCTEERIALDLAWTKLQRVVDLAVELVTEQAVIDAIKSRLTGHADITGPLIEAWRTAGVADANIRSAIGKTAHQKGWFKTISYGGRLGQLVGESLDEIPGSELSVLIGRVGAWVYGA